jgi:hypothetical protein
MSLRELNRLVGTAMSDPRFCEALLGDGRGEKICTFDLTVEEQTVLLRIRASTLQEFAQGLYRWMNDGGSDGSAYQRPIEAGELGFGLGILGLTGDRVGR